MVRTFFTHLRHQWMGALALFFVLTGGTAYALDGSNTVFTDDIVNGEVKTGDIGDFEVKGADIAPDSLGGGKIADRSVKNADLSLGASSSNTIADDGVKGIDVDESSLDFECPAGYELAGKDVCYEPGPASAAHTNADFATALSTCAGNGDRLPTLAEAMSVMTDLPTPGDEEVHETWTVDHNGGGEIILLRKNEFGVISRSSATGTTSRGFRCVTSPHG